MKLTLEPTNNDLRGVQFATVIICHPCDSMGTEDILQEVVKPALLAWGLPTDSLLEMTAEGRDALSIAENAEPMRGDNETNLK